MGLVTVVVAEICRYPVKGLGAERLVEAWLSSGEGLPLDRCFAICHGDSAFDPARPRWQRRREFLHVAHDPRLVLLRASFEAATQTLTITQAGEIAISEKVSDEAGRGKIEAFLTAFMRNENRGPFRLVSAPGVMFTDQSTKFVSFIHRASLADLATHLGAYPDEARFRGNLIIDGGRPWQEFEWLGREIQVGDARLRIVGRTDRCAATMANPRTGDRDQNIP